MVRVLSKALLYTYQKVIFSIIGKEMSIFSPYTGSDILSPERTNIFCVSAE